MTNPLSPDVGVALTEIFKEHYNNFRHCDDYIDDTTQPEDLRKWLLFSRMPAAEQYEMLKLPTFVAPHLYAVSKVNRTYSFSPEQIRGFSRRFEPIPDHNIKVGMKVRLVMASRFGDVGVTKYLNQATGYQHRVHIEHLTDFSTQP